MKTLHAKDCSRYRVNHLCELFGVTKQAYYKKNEESCHRRIAEESLAIEYVRDVRKKDPGIGGRKLYYMYKRDFANDCHVGRDAFERVLSDYGLKLRNKKRKPRTTDSRHGLPTFPNLTKDYLPSSPNELWVSDITYIPISHSMYGVKFCYLSLVLDAYTEEIKGWFVGETLSTIYPLKALEMALESLDVFPVQHSLIHHSDRGSQYASREYVKALKEVGIAISMTESGNPKDNAQAERINNIIKNELFKDMKFNSIGEVRKALKRAISFYNNERPHMSIDMHTPAEAADKSGEIPKRWRSFRSEAIKNNVCVVYP